MVEMGFAAPVFAKKRTSRLFGVIYRRLPPSVRGDAGYDGTFDAFEGSTSHRPWRFVGWSAILLHTFLELHIPIIRWIHVKVNVGGGGREKGFIVTIGRVHGLDVLPPLLFCDVDVVRGVISGPRVY